MPNRKERRKQKRESQKHKPRFVGLQFSLDDIPKEELKSLKIGTRITEEGVEAIIKTDKRVIETNAIKGYKRETKPGFNLKKTNSISNTSKMEVNSNLKKFKTLIAIDTNSNFKQSPSIHVGVAAQILSKLENENIVTKFKVIKVLPIEGECERPENHNWRILIKYIETHQNHLTDQKIGIIVDSDLGNLNDYNNRKKPIIADFFLPDNFELLYASADASNDELTNQVISFCDKIASEALKEMEESLA